MTLIPPYLSLAANKKTGFFALATVFALFMHINDCKGQEVLRELEVHLPRQHASVYELLGQISRKTGYFFVYDSDLINNNRRIRLPETTTNLGKLLNTILDDPSLQFKELGNHILIYRDRETPEPAQAAALPKQDETPLPYFIVRGRILDAESGTPLPFASIGIQGSGIGVASNAEGIFVMKLSNAHLDQYLHISYLGYKSQQFPMRFLSDRFVDVLMETDYISMQEVIIRYYDPEAIVREAIEKIATNYSSTPVYQVNFYREGVQRNKRLLNYSEAIFRVYKSAYNDNLDSDQVVLLKSRNIVNIEEADTLMLKIKAGIRSALELDVINVLPIFLNLAYLDDNRYNRVDIVNKDSRPVYAIEFEQTNPKYLPVYRGILYIDMESLAILSVDFEVHPKYISKSGFIFLSNKSRKFHATFDRIYYSVSYQFFDGAYHLRHVRGDLEVRFRPRNRLFSNNYLAYFEMVVGQIETRDVTRFSRREVMKTDVIFIDQTFSYDYDFWGQYNIIAPESQINENFSQIRSKIESVINEPE